MTIRAKEESAQTICAVIVGHNLPVLARVIAVASYFDIAFAVEPCFIDHVDAMSVGLVRVLETVPSLWTEAGQGRYVAPLHCDVKSHRRCRRGYVGDRYVCVCSGICFAAGSGYHVECGGDVEAWECIGSIAATPIALKMSEPISLHEFHLWVIFVVVVPYRFVDVPDE